MSDVIEDPKPRQEIEQPVADEEELASLNGTKPRQWLMDRSNGCSKVDEGRLGRPFCPVCWPPPCVKIAPDFFEQNSCCEWFGNIGAFPEDHETSRIWLMRKSLVVHLAGFIMSALACLAITSNPGWLQAFSFSSGVVTGTVGETDVQKVNFEVGLTTVYSNDFYFGERTYELNELCTGKTFGIPLTPVEDCQTCSEASSGLVFTVIMGVVTYLPTIGSNVNRAYYNYDVNCQKVFGTIVALISMFMSLYTWHGYARQCFGSFFDGDVTIPVLVPRDAGNRTFNPENYPYIDMFDPTVLNNRSAEDIQQNGISIEEVFPGVNATVLAETEIRIAQVNFDWHPGVGLILVVAATFSKMLDVINHFLIRTPSITRDIEEQMEYEKKYGKGSSSQRECEEEEKEDDEEANKVVGQEEQTPSITHDIEEQIEYEKKNGKGSSHRAGEEEKEDDKEANEVVGQEEKPPSITHDIEEQIEYEKKNGEGSGSQREVEGKEKEDNEEANEVVEQEE